MKRAGFTLIELVVAMAIMSVLAAAMWGNFSSSLAKGRDNRRKQDISSIAKALELYYNDFGRYPAALPAWGEALLHDNNSSVIYMQKLPNDPAYPNATYCYAPTLDLSSYSLYADLENANDSDALSVEEVCDGWTYNYKIANVAVSE